MSATGVSVQWVFGDHKFLQVFGLQENRKCFILVLLEKCTLSALF